MIGKRNVGRKRSRIWRLLGRLGFDIVGEEEDGEEVVGEEEDLKIRINYHFI
jgi:hypothetical protein